MSVQVFSVGDVVRLDGSGWEHYCSKPLAGRSFTVESVEEDGRARIPIVSAGGGDWYMGWVDPVEGAPLSGVIVSRKGDDDEVR